LTKETSIKIKNISKQKKRNLKTLDRKKGIAKKKNSLKNENERSKTRIDKRNKHSHEKFIKQTKMMERKNDRQENQALKRINLSKKTRKASETKNRSTKESSIKK
jgi:hypothetical protein